MTVSPPPHCVRHVVNVESNPAITADARQRLLDLAAGCFSARVLHVAAEIGLADALVDGPWRAEELAERTGTEAGALARVLRTMAAMGLVEHGEDGRFSLTVDGEVLRSDVPGSARAGIRLLALWWSTWSALEHSIRSGEPAAEVVFGKPAFDHIGESPERLAIFQEGMRGLQVDALPQIAAAIGGVGSGSVVDVAGGHGSLLAAVLENSPEATGVVLDRPEVAPEAWAFLSGRGLGSRAAFVPGDMFRAVPAGADVYLLKWILHDWADDDCLRLLRVLRSAMRDDTRLVVVERVLPERVSAGAEALRAQLSDLRMLAAFGGRERTLAAFDDLFAAAGLARGEVIATAAGLQVITVRRKVVDR